MKGLAQGYPVGEWQRQAKNPVLLTPSPGSWALGNAACPLNSQVNILPFCVTVSNSFANINIHSRSVSLVTMHRLGQRHREGRASHVFSRLSTFNSPRCQLQLHRLEVSQVGCQKSEATFGQSA